jgi:hypothetical protein
MVEPIPGGRIRRVGQVPASDVETPAGLVRRLQAIHGTPLPTRRDGRSDAPYRQVLALSEAAGAWTAPDNARERWGSPAASPSGIRVLQGLRSPPRWSSGPDRRDLLR